MVGTRRCLNRVAGDLDVAVGAILEPDRRRQTGGEFAVHLALGGARANRAPGDQVAQVLGRDHVQKLTASGQAQAIDLDEQLARNTQSLVDAEGFVQIGVVDQALPADRGARFFKIHPHHDLQRVGIGVALLFEQPCIGQRRRRVVDRAGADHHQQPVVLAGHDVVYGLAGAGNQGFNRRTLDRKKTHQVFRRWEHGNVLDSFVVGDAGSVASVVGLGLGWGGHVNHSWWFKGQKKPPGLPAVFGEFENVYFSTLEPSRPPTAPEKPK